MAEANPKEYFRIGLGFNPSVCDDYVLIRTANYDLDVTPSQDWEPNTVNYLGRLRGRMVENLNPLDDSPRSLVFQNGLEDGRLIRHNGRLLGLFSGLFQTKGPWVVTKNTMILMDLETKEYRSFPTGKREKNWMPFIREGNLCAITSTKPLRVVSLEDGSLIKEGPGLDTFWSGSSQLIPHSGGWLGVVHRHESKESNGACRDYVHAFLHMDEDFNLSVSRPFRFFGKGVEFCSGLTRHGNELCLSFGVHDRESFLTWVGLSDSPTNESS